MNTAGAAKHKSTRAKDIKKEWDAPSTFAINGSHKDPQELIAFPLLFARQLAKTPNNAAILFENHRYSYRELEKSSNQIRDALLPLLPQNNGTAVGICIDKSPEAIAAMLGILKAGGAFVPLDPDYPPDRISYMIQDAGINIFIAQPEYQQSLETAFYKPDTRKIDNNKAFTWINCYQPLESYSKPSAIHDPCIKPNDLAYIMYTSGSTGKPKGVQIEHAALATYCFADIDTYKVEENDRTLQFSTLNFDIAIEEIFPPLLTGSCIVIRPAQRSKNLNELSDIINKYNVTAVHIATAYWHEWVDLILASGDQIPECLRLMVVTGEAVSVKHYQHWKALCEKNTLDILWCNAYGPTEATVSASVFIPDQHFADSSMPIGKPLKRYQAIIVDENYHPLTIGETGQLLIGGPALARGYLNRHDLNQQAFVTVQHNGIPQRMYKTGDLARWLPNGDIAFAGRIDHQIKLGSYRIEPGEIEAVLNQYEAVLESLIVYQEVAGKKVLIAYVAKAENSVTSIQLQTFLQTRLPAYMVPARYILLSRFPKTTNGKIDRKGLPDVSTSEIPHASGYVEPRNHLERDIADIWQQVLGLPKIGIHDDFFALGGSSLLAVGIVARLIETLNLELPVRDFFANPTIASLSRHIAFMLKNDIYTKKQKHNDHDQIDDNQMLRNRLPIVNPGFFEHSYNHQTQRIFAVHYLPPPSPNASKPKGAVLICHPLGHEYSRSYRNLQQLAVLLSRQGFNVLRFDYAGSGNSHGHCSMLSAQSCIADIQAAYRYLRKQSQSQNISIIAVRAGAPLASLAIKNQKNIDKLIIWDPILNGDSFIALLEKFHHRALTLMERFIKVRKRSQTDQLFGYAMSKQKRQSLSELKMPHEIANIPARKHILITSKSYLENEKNACQRLKHWHHLPVDDEIHWHQPEFTESAFSSPQVFQHILKALETQTGDVK